jgi:Fe2+ transport system protein FeoA
VDGSGAVRQRLLDMGILPGVTIEVERVAPAGDPLWIRLQGYQLSLRRAEAKAIAIEAIV